MSGENARIVASHIEHLKPLKVQVPVQGPDEHLPEGEEGVEGPGAEYDGVRRPCYMLVSIEIKGRGGGVCSHDITS